jgi:diaminopimelate epimerase
MKIKFSKYQGTGNDFVILDNRDQKYSNLTTQQIAFLCNRRFGIGADGLMMLQLKDGFDFEMKYFNADGKEGSMCGNGGRCIVQFARDLNLIQSTTRFIASDGSHDALITDAGWIELNMINVNSIEKRDNISILNTGSPHYIQPVKQLDSLDVESLGKRIRYNDEFINSGINVNFIEPLADGLHIRTYERGVEAETLSCGTGATAAALSVATVSANPQNIVLQTQGGELKIKFLHTKEQQFRDIRLCGPATFVFSGVIAL